MAFEAKKVIAVEIDPTMIELIEVFQENLPSRLEGKVEARLVQPNDPGLEPGEADIAVIINTIAYHTRNLVVGATSRVIPTSESLACA